FTPRAREIQMDAWVLGFTFLVAVLTSLLSGTVPALAARETVVGALNEGGAQSTIGRGKHRMRSLLIVAQVAVSFLLLIGAGLLLRSFMKLRNSNPAPISSRKETATCATMSKLLIRCFPRPMVDCAPPSLSAPTTVSRAARAG